MTIKLTREEATELLEQVIDTLIEVGNGTTDQQLHTAADQLLKFRDKYFNISDSSRVQAPAQLSN